MKVPALRMRTRAPQGQEGMSVVAVNATVSTLGVTDT